MKKDNNFIKKIGTFRINRLFYLAREKTMENKNESSRLSKRYIKIAKDISRHYKIKINQDFKNSICDECNGVLIPGVSCRVRVLNRNLLVYICDCGAQKKVFIKTAK